MWIIFGITSFLFFCNILREIHVYRSIKNTFTCDNCGTVQNVISGIHKCTQCKRSFKLGYKQWEHLLLHRVTWIEVSSKTKELELKEYLKVPKIEIIISLIATIVLILGVVINI